MKRVPSIVSSMLLVAASAANKDGWMAGVEHPVRCDIAAIDVSELTMAMFKRDHEDKAPVLIRGATKDWAAHRRWTRQYLSKRFGDWLFESKRPSKDPICGPTGAEYLVAPFRQQKVTLASFLSQMSNKDAATCTTKCSAAQNPGYIFAEIPRGSSAHKLVYGDIDVGTLPFPWPFSAETYFSVGATDSGLGMHRHLASWCAVIHGSKFWTFKQGFDELYEKGCHHNAGVRGTQTCIQEAGDLLYLPPKWGHSVTNQGDVVAVVSVQTDEEDPPYNRDHDEDDQSYLQHEDEGGLSDHRVQDEQEQQENDGLDYANNAPPGVEDSLWRSYFEPPG